MEKKQKKPRISARTNGLQARIAEKAKINPGTVSQIFSGRRKPTALQAAKIEQILVGLGFNLTRWDLLYSPPGTPLLKARVAIAQQEAMLARGGLRSEAVAFLNPEGFQEAMLAMPKSPYRRPYPTRRPSKGEVSNG